MKNTIYEVKKFTGWTQEQNEDDIVSECEDRSIKIIQFEEQRKKIRELRKEVLGT